MGSIWCKNILSVGCCRSFWEVPLRLRLIRPSILLARAVMPFMRICHDMVLDMVTPRYGSCDTMESVLPPRWYSLVGIDRIATEGYSFTWRLAQLPGHLAASTAPRTPGG